MWTEQEIDEKEYAIGEKLRDASDELQHQIHELTEERKDLDDAWKKHDWQWLARAGYLTKSEADFMDE
jgi:hypothetical protein